MDMAAMLLECPEPLQAFWVASMCICVARRYIRMDALRRDPARRQAGHQRCAFGEQGVLFGPACIVLWQPACMLNPADKEERCFFLIRLGADEGTPCIGVLARSGPSSMILSQHSPPSYSSNFAVVDWKIR